MKYIDYKIYERLYNRFLSNNGTNRILDLIEKKISLQDKFFFDICCGNGRASIEAVKRGCTRLVLVDENPNIFPQSTGHMLKYNMGENRNNIRISFADINEFLKEPLMKRTAWAFIRVDKKYAGCDIAFCQQAINYWATKENIKSIHLLMRKEGIFAFDTFNQKPPSKQSPLLKEYRIEKDGYIEISWTDDVIVKHIQILNEEELNFSKFKWFSREQFKEMLDGLFNFEINTFGKTDIYVCTPI